MSGRPLLLVTLPLLSVLAICLYLRRRGRPDPDSPPEPPPPDQPAEEATVPPAGGQTGRDLDQVTAWVRDNIETLPEVEEESAVRAENAAAVAAERGEPEGALEGEAAEAAAGGVERKVADRVEGEVLRELEAAVLQAQAGKDGGSSLSDEKESVVEEATVLEEGSPVSVKKERNVEEVNEEAPVTPVMTALTSEKPPVTKQPAPTPEAQPAETTQEPPATTEQASETTPSPADPVSGAEASEPAADTASENSSDSGKGGSSASIEQASPSASPESAPMQTTVYNFLIPQKLCGRLIGKNGTFVNMLKARTGAHVVIRLHPVKSSVKICSVEGTQSEIDACLKLIREKFPLNKFPAMTLEQLNRPTEPTLAVPDSQQLHLPQGVACDVLVSAVVSAGQLFLQQHTHPTFRGLERLNALMAACYTDGSSTPELPRPVLASSICAAPVAGGWYRAQVVAAYPEADELDVRFMDYGGYSRIPAAEARQIRTDFMSLPFQAEECYLANVMPVSDDGWSVEAGAVLETLISERALEAMVVGYAEDGTPFVNLYTIQGTEYGNNAISLVNQQLVESGAARWIENQA